MRDVYLCEGTRSAIGRFGGALSPVRPDNLLADIIKGLMTSAPTLDSAAIDDVIIGCANQAGEDNRNVARMAVLLAGLPDSVPGATVNRLCGSGLDAVGTAARAVACGEADLMIAGGVESMSRAPFVMPKADAAFSRKAEIYDTTIGWRFINKTLKQQYGVDSMPETAENVAEQFNISREDQDAFALRSQQKAAAAIKNGRLSKEITPVSIAQRKADAMIFEVDEHPRATTMDKLSSLPTLFKEGGCITAGNASGVNDGAAALIVASAEAVKNHQLTPRARFVGMSTAGVEPRIMGVGPAPASQKLLSRLALNINDIDVIELNEAFAAQGLAVTRELGIADDDERVNPNGGAIALGHPLGMSGARLALTAAIELQERQVQKALCTMCIGVGQGIAMVLERA